MVILIWDQEKIVLLNLILFLYFLYYTSGGAIEEIFISRRNAIRSTIKANIVLTLEQIRTTLQQIKLFTMVYGQAVLIGLHKLNLAVGVKKNPLLNLKHLENNKRVMLTWALLKAVNIHLLNLAAQQKKDLKHTNTTLTHTL